MQRFVLSVFLVFCGSLAVADEAVLTTPLTTPQRVAETYGLKTFGQVEALRYTFNVHRDGTEMTRSWEWQPKTDKVIFSGHKDDGSVWHVSYKRTTQPFAPGSEQDQVDRWFINDVYWLLFPFHLVWDSSTTIQQATSERAGEEKWVVSYLPDVGYTPGDAYDVYVSSQFFLTSWTFRKGGVETPSLTTSWERHAQSGPVVICLEHKAPEGDFRLWFTDVAVKHKGRWDPVVEK